MFKSIKSKFIALSLGVIIISIGVPVWILLEQVSQNFHDRSALMIEATIDLMIDGLNESMMRGDRKNVQYIVEQISDKTGIEHIRIFDKNGLIKYSDDSKEVGNLINALEPGHIAKDILDITEREIELNKSTNTYKVIQPILIEDRCQTCHQENKIISYLDVDTDFTKAEMTYYTGSLHMIFLGIALIFILAVGFYFLFNKLINKPLNNFILALDSVESGKLDIVLPTVGNDEFTRLNYHFNRMVHEIKASREEIDELHFEQLQRADKMVTLGELTASMAHDINNYSAIIMSRADYLLYESENKNFPSQITEDLKVINNQIEKISGITGNILKHSKKLSKSFTEIDLNKIITNVSDMMNPVIVKQKVNLICEVRTDDTSILGDPNQLEQVLLNLIGNSLDAIDKKGDINIILQKNSNDKLELIVEDNGNGIDKESLEMIFSPFYTNKPADKGTGLGLYIVANICKNHNATVECHSEVNIGTKFKITFNGRDNV